MATIIVDLTPLLPGGENGGAKPMILALMRELPDIMSQDNFILLTSDTTHDELAFLERDNVVRRCTLTHTQSSGETKTVTKTVRVRPPLIPWIRWRLKLAWWAIVWGTFEIFARAIPRPVKDRFKNTYYKIFKINPEKEVSKPAEPATQPAKPAAQPTFLEKLNADLLFCPFTAPTYSEKEIPTVSVIYDLQSLDLPQFFDLNEFQQRQIHINNTFIQANHVITISEFTRQSVLKNSSLKARQITPIQIGVVHQFQKIDHSQSKQILGTLGIKEEQFLFYPANFWPHKNHATLVLALSFYLRKYPESKLKLVCTGALDKGRDEINLLAQALGVSEHICLPGYVSTDELTVLYQSARALIFPSLYEGFGMPVLEAMANGVPVLCSNMTSLPEVAGDAALFFDPRSPKSIAQAIETILNASSQQKQDLIQKGHARVKFFGDAKRMAHEYALVLEKTLAESPAIKHDR